MDNRLPKVCQPLSKLGEYIIRPPQLCRSNPIIDYDNNNKPIYADNIYYDCKNGGIDTTKMLSYDEETLKHIMKRNNLCFLDGKIIKNI